jgi:hypothetical protein
MIKLKLTWEMEDGSKFEEWTRPIELANAEKDLYGGKSIIAVLRDEQSTSQTLTMYLAHKIHQRISDKPVGNLEQWSKKIIEVGMPEFELPKDSNPEA